MERGTDETSWNVFGRGVLHLSVLVETMRREGYELQVGQPQVIIKEIDGVKCEPVEQLTVNTPEEINCPKTYDLNCRKIHIFLQIVIKFISCVRLVISNHLPKN